MLGCYQRWNANHKESVIMPDGLYQRGIYASLSKYFSGGSIKVKDSFYSNKSYNAWMDLELSKNRDMHRYMGYYNCKNSTTASIHHTKKTNYFLQWKKIMIKDGVKTIHGDLVFIKKDKA